MEDANPYQAPASLEAESPQPSTAARLPVRLLAGWTAVFLLNMAVPLLFGWNMTAKHGRIGMFAAAVLLLFLGGWVCVVREKLGRALVRGGVGIGLGQLLPVLQVMAGLAAMDVGHLLRQVKGDDILSEPGGFIMTIVTGGLLMCAAFVLGLFMGAISAQLQRGET
jgi:hypothetical protein